MLSLAINSYTTPLNYELLDFSTPELSSPTDVLVKVHAASINPGDVKTAAGATRVMMPLTFPYKIGLDLSGTVVRVGEAVTEFAEGDEVFGMLPLTRGDNLPPIDDLEGVSAHHITPASSDNYEQGDSAHHITPASDSPEVTEESRRYVVGLLTSTALTLDHWQATDFVALNALLDCPEENSSWLCGKEIRNGPGFLLGDPACDRIIFAPPPFEEIVDTVEPVGKIRKLIEFRYTFLQRIRNVVPKLTPDDTLFLVICGHGSEEGIVFLGNAYNHITLHPADVECALEGCAATVYLIITACFSGSWKSKRWNLIAAAGADQESVSIAQSDSGHFRGGVFTTALLAEHVDQYGLRAPKPGPVTYTQNSSGGYSKSFEQMEHDFGPPRYGQRHPIFLVPRKRTSEVLEWLHKLRDDMGRTYASADFKICPCREDDTVWQPLFADLTNSPTLQRNKVQPPSQAPPASGDSLRNLQSTEPVLLEENEKVFLSLVRDHLRFAPPETLSEVYLLRNCNALVNDQHFYHRSLTAEDKAETVKILRQRQNYRFLACSIAQRLGWRDAVIEVGSPFAEQRQLDHNLSLQAQAADHGYLLWDLHVFQFNTLWKGVAGWLARVWEAAGKPTIDAKKWRDTLEECSELAGITLELDSAQ